MSITSFVNLESFETIQSNMVVNGQPVGGTKVQFYRLLCNNCKRILEEFQAGAPLVGIIDEINNSIKYKYIYCPNCGCKLAYNLDIINDK